MKISIIGYSGSGKSSFATKLSEKYHIVATYMDKYHFEPGWVERDTHLRNQMLEEVIKKDQWIIDGNYSKILKERFELADQIFIFNFNRFKCLYGALIRRIKYRNKTRRSMTEGNNEKLDLEFIIWILFKSRTKNRRLYYQNLKELFPQKVLEFKKRKQVNKYLESINIYDFKEKS
ncbi:DNA topology modulation protein FlaR [Hujiaoplasma nucleasis]|uniref:DNA topology modulation protein FlaR n=1 Tax=Hujiaoplasma nucleasis TaxID=2725268 RepID=A0A7L6N599_9MOLU|nr:hypothetical protein [Hujiaoplasma nucleasis]QLY40662.1 DNA topology modulation protein FlaR [Hujiaoplasma nucleasis]